MNKEFDPALQDILLRLNVGSEEFFSFIASRVVSLSLKFDQFPWATFPKYDSFNNLVDIRVLVPRIIDEKTLLVNIHEFTHAYELYLHLKEKFEPDVNLSERLVRSKERLYLKLTKKNMD